MYRLLLFAGIFISTLSCAQTQEKKQSARESVVNQPDSLIKEQKNQIANEFSRKKIDYIIIKVPDDQFGYYIMIDGGLYIEQKTIPAIEGNQGFKTREDAEKIAGLVIQKLREGEVPPTISVEDLIAHEVIDK